MRRCWLGRSAVSDILIEVAKWPLRETGGALLGWREDDEWVVHTVLGPGPRARHGFSTFEPDAEWQVERGRSIYRESGGMIAYVGEWHSHPRGSRRPSRQDTITMREIASDPAFRAPEPLSAIISRPRWPPLISSWDISMYVLAARELHSIDLAPFETLITAPLC